MGSNCDEPMKISENDAAGCSATMVEIKIKTLDSQTFTLRVDKCVPVPELKEQIASLTGVLSGQQRLICRGRVLKDDQLLSAYHVEDGHTLHLVERQPVAPSPDSLSDQPATDPTSSTGHNPGNRVGPGMVVGTFNLTEQGDGALPDLNRIVSAVLNSFGLARFGSGGEGIDLNQPPSERQQAAPSSSGPRNSSNLSSDQAAPIESLQPPIIPDSLTTLLQYLSFLRQEFVANVGGQSVNSQNPGSGNDGQDVEATAPSSESRRLLTPEFLAEVMTSTRQLLVEQASGCLSQLAGRLNSQATMTDPLQRSTVQSNAIRSGALFQNLGALLLELGRAIMTLRMGQSPADALVNAGPSVFVSPTGPNPIMVQPMSFQPGASFGSIPVGTVQHGSGLAGGSAGAGFLPRNIDIRIRTGSLFSRREQTVSQPQGQDASVSSGSVNSGQENAIGTNSNSRETQPQVRALPIRTVVAALPSSIARGSDSSRGSIGILYPVMARVQHVATVSRSGTRASQTPDGPNNGNPGQPTPDPAAQNTRVLRGHGNTTTAEPLNDQEFSAHVQSGLEQLLRTVFPGDHVINGHANPTAPGLVATQTAAAAAPAAAPAPAPATATQEVGSSQAAASTASNEGILLSNVLRHIMPMISENTGSESNTQPTAAANTVETQVDETSDQATTSRRRRNPQPQQNVKRRRRN